jgi:ferric-dicitrate binding protein FerR (iron transport regulator)
LQPKDQRRIARWHVAAVISVTLPIAFFLSDKSNAISDRTTAIAADEPTVQLLGDGSRVSLNAGAMLRVEFTDHRREVHLEHGRVVFDVVKDQKRPFIVNTLLVAVAAAAESKFSVEVDTTVEVQVFKGTVDVSKQGGKAGAAIIRVRSGEIFRMPLDGFRTVVADGAVLQNSPVISM